MIGNLFLIPTPLGIDTEISMLTQKTVKEIRHFIVESEKEARRFLAKCGYDLKNHYPEFYILNEHSKPNDIFSMTRPLMQGLCMGLMSDAGLPAVADPGNVVVAFCHQNNIPIAPLPGQSSIMQALMCSGFNGQAFRFHGYIPVRNPERIQKIRLMEQECLQFGVTQIFIETPYRNKVVLEDLLKVLKKDTKLCMVKGIDTGSISIVSKPAGQWNVPGLTDLKVPAVLLIGN